MLHPYLYAIIVGDDPTTKGVDQMETTVQEPTRFEITETLETGHKFFVVLKDGEVLKDRDGHTRFYQSRNAARKRISRERKQNFHN